MGSARLFAGVGCIFVLAATSLGCSSDGDGPPLIEEPAPVAAWPNLGCDALVPEHCGFPFPSNVYTVPAETPTGRRVNILPEMMPETVNGDVA